MAVLNNVECRWASVIEPNTTYEPVWEIEAVLTDEQAAQLADQGLAIKTKDGEKTYRFKKKVGGKRKDGTDYTNDAPRVVDGNKQPFEELIGNGSIVNIAYSLREWSMMGNSGIKGDLKAVQVVEHVPYAGGGSDEFEEIGGTAVKEAVSVDDEDDDAPF